MSVDTAYPSALQAIAEQVKSRVEQVLTEQGLSHADLWRKLGFRSASGYWKMYSNGTLDLRKVARIAIVLNVDPDRVLLGSAMSSGRKTGPYVEERLEIVEREVRQLRTQLKK